MPVTSCEYKLIITSYSGGPAGVVIPTQLVAISILYRVKFRMHVLN